MKIKDFLNKWYNKQIEDWGGETSPEYRSFQTNYRSVIKDFCKNIGMELYSFNKNHYDFSAIIKSNITNQFYYISIPDVRYWKNEWANKILYRTMENEKDWTGGSNRYSTLENLSDNLLSLDKQILRNLEKENARHIIDHSELQKTNIEDFEINCA